MIPQKEQSQNAKIQRTIYGGLFELGLISTTLSCLSGEDTGSFPGQQLVIEPNFEQDFFEFFFSDLVAPKGAVCCY